MSSVTPAGHCAMTTQQIAAPAVPEGLGRALLEKIRTGAIGRNGHSRVLATRASLQKMALYLVGESYATALAPYDAADLYDVEQWADSMFADIPDGEEAVLLLPNEAGA